MKPMLWARSCSENLDYGIVRHAFDPKGQPDGMTAGRFGFGIHEVRRSRFRDSNADGGVAISRRRLKRLRPAPPVETKPRSGGVFFWQFQ